MVYTIKGPENTACMQSINCNFTILKNYQLIEKYRNVYKQSDKQPYLDCKKWTEVQSKYTRNKHLFFKMIPPSYLKVPLYDKTSTVI